MDMPKVKAGRYWDEAAAAMEPHWPMVREDAGRALMCARCLLLLTIPNNSSAVIHTRDGVFPTRASGDLLLQQVRQARGYGHAVLLNGSRFGIFADTMSEGEALCSQHLLYAVADRGNARAPSL